MEWAGQWTRALGREGRRWKWRVVYGPGRLEIGRGVVREMILGRGRFGEVGWLVGLWLVCIVGLRVMEWVG